jgi:hypothetical protein
LVAIRPEPQCAPDERQIDALEMAWITTSEGARLFRGGNQAPPLRGTMFGLSDRELVLYTTGSVEFYSTYPGHYGRSPSAYDRLIRCAAPERPAPKPWR